MTPQFMSVDRPHSFNRNDFSERIADNRPFVFTLAWPAMEKWSLPYFQEIASDLPVSISQKIDETGGETKRMSTTFGNYLSLLESLETQDVKKGFAPYLKQFDMLAEKKDLLDDVDFSFIPAKRKDMALWVGARNSVTGTHCDPNHGVLVQVYGKKKVYLLSPDQRQYLYPNTKFDPATECCDVDVDTPDFDAHPLFSKASGFVAELSPGDALFIPRKWYHYIVGQSNNISVNCFFFSQLEYLTVDLVRYRIPKYLHDRGLYKVGNCVCHVSARQSDAWSVKRAD